MHSWLNDNRRTFTVIYLFWRAGSFAVFSHYYMAGSFGPVALREEKVIGNEVRIFSFSKKRFSVPKQELPLYSSSSIDNVWKQQCHLRHRIGSYWWSWWALITNIRIFSSLRGPVDLALALATFLPLGKWKATV